jgi:hypothetical protein
MEIQDCAVTPEMVSEIIRNTGTKRFDELQLAVADLVKPRPLNAQDRKSISDALRARICEEASDVRCRDDKGYRGILLFTAYTNDYVIGELTDTVNKRYADRRGYHYLTHVIPYKDMLDAIGPRKKHCTWYKVLMINQFLNDTEMINEKKLQYIMWIDADALVVDDNIAVENIIRRGGDRDLIIAENMHAGCLVNAGVLLIRISDWSRQLWKEVWECSKYDDVTFYEQSALMRRLRAKREGLDLLLPGVPFHSYLPGAPKGVKLYAHVAVFPHLDLNTNCGWIFVDSAQIGRNRGRRAEKAKKRIKSHIVSTSGKVREVEGEPMGGEGTVKVVEEDGSISGKAHSAEEGVQNLDSTRESYMDLGCGNDVESSLPSDIETRAAELADVPDPAQLDEVAYYEAYLTGLQMPKFIFHAAGHCGKIECLRGIMQKMNIPVPEEFLAMDKFRLEREKLKN